MEGREGGREKRKKEGKDVIFIFHILQWEPSMIIWPGSEKGGGEERKRKNESRRELITTNFLTTLLKD